MTVRLGTLTVNVGVHFERPERLSKKKNILHTRKGTSESHNRKGTSEASIVWQTTVFPPARKRCRGMINASRVVSS